ncbi:MAG: sugar phosphate isomerase/epimerase [Chloroflexi bacterium]|nr:sugar phosphate isomerase/epimerase [Chloroflexota bacterium]
MRIGLSTACLYGFPLRHTLRTAADCGFDGIELVMTSEVWLRGAAGVARLCREYGLDVLSVHVALLPPRLPIYRDGRLRAATRMALELGSPCVVFHGPFARWDTAKTRHWLESVETCLTLVTGTGTRLALENVALYDREHSLDVLGPIPVLCSFARRYGLALTLDTCHVGNGPLDLLQVYEQMRPYLVNVHLSDYGRGPISVGHMPGSWYHRFIAEHQFPGEGDLPLNKFLAALAGDGYKGSINLEIGPLHLKVWSSSRTRQRLGEALAFVRQALSNACPE